MIRVSAPAFFLAVDPLPRWMWIAFAAAIVFGGWTPILDPWEIDSSLAPVLFLQMFAASGGFHASAARGHYDPILVRGGSRSAIALASLAASAAPGLTAWLTLVVAALMSGCPPELALAPHRHVAVALVSCGAWWAGLAIPRLAAGALWAVLLVAMAVSRTLLMEQLAVVQSRPGDVAEILASAAVFTVCPFLMLGSFAAALDPRVLAVTASAAGLMAWSGVRRVARHDYTLTEPS